MNYLGLTVFAGNTPGLILDFDSATKEYTVEFTDGRVVKTATVFWENSIPADPEVAMYRKASMGNGEQLVFEDDGWDIVSNTEEDDDDLCEKCGGDGCSHCDYKGYHVSKISRPIEIVNQPSDLGDWVDEHKAEEGYTPKGDYGPDGPAPSLSDPDLGKHNDIDNRIDKLEDKVDRLLEIVEDKDDEESVNTDGIQPIDHDGTEDSYWDRQTKPSPNLDEQFPSGTHSERYPGTLNPKAKVAKDCGCWDGYKRVPGTKPCAPGSCEKCDSARKEAAKKKQNSEEAVKKVNTVPPAGVRAAAKRGLKYYEEGKAGDGFEAATADRARRIAAGEALTEEHINRMHSFFERHAGGRSKKAKPGEVTAWDVAWLCWGGDAGRSWASKVDAQLHKARHPNSKGKHSSEKTADAGGAGVFTPERNEPEEQWDRSTIDEEGSTANKGINQVEKNFGTGDIDRDGNPIMRGVGDDAVFPEMEDVDFPEPPLDLTDALVEEKKKAGNPNEDVWDRTFSHAIEEAEWEDRHYAKNPECTTCRDPLVNGVCHNCGDDHSKEIKKAAKKQKQFDKAIASLKPRAAELGTLFGLALAGRRKESTTQPSEDIFTVHIDGQDSDPSIGGTGGYNLKSGDGPELLKSVDGYAGVIDATPNLIIEGMPKVIELSESEESGEDNPILKALEKVLDINLGDVFTEHKEKAKKKKESKLAAERRYCNVCGNFFNSNKCVDPDLQAGQSRPNCPAVNSTAEGVTPNTSAPPISPSNTAPKGYAAPAAGKTPGYSTGVPGALASVSEDIDISSEEDGLANSDRIVDINGEQLEVGETYRLHAGIDDEPEIVRVEEATPTTVQLTRVDSSFPENEGEPYEITLDQFNAEDMRFNKTDSVNPNEIGIGSVPATDGTPETMDDAGPGQNDIPGITDLSTGRKAGIEHTAGRHYLPNQQKEFINEPGKARNLDKLILEGTHYVNGEVTASDNFDDDFLFGV